MKSYLVLLRDVDDKIGSTICKNNDEVAQLLLHLDTEKYSVEKIEVVNEFNHDIKGFCKQDSNLETGK